MYKNRKILRIFLAAICGVSTPLIKLNSIHATETAQGGESVDITNPIHQLSLTYCARVLPGEDWCNDEKFETNVRLLCEALVGRGTKPTVNLDLTNCKITAEKLKLLLIALVVPSDQNGKAPYEALTNKKIILPQTLRPLSGTLQSTKYNNTSELWDRLAGQSSQVSLEFK